MTEEFNRTTVTFPGGAILHGRFEAQAASTPEAVALEFEGQEISYARLDRMANQVARRLARAGVGPEVLVGVCAERSLELPVALLGVLKAGGAYVPLDPSYPTERLRYMLQDSRVGVVLVQRRFESLMASCQVEVLSMDPDWADFGAESTECPGVEVRPEHAAYMIYTSGSTGRPKGAVNLHRGICNRLDWMQAGFPIGPGDVVLQKTPTSFDVSVWELFWPLLAGARELLARPGGQADPRYLGELIAARGVTAMHFVPSMLEAFLDIEGDRRQPSLRHVFCSGEALWPGLVARFFEWSDAQLHNLYGPTEAAVDVSRWTCDRSAPRGVVPIGRPVANTRLYVLDEARRPVGIGVAGELHVAGVQVARGYWERPELTAERFVPDPFVGAEPGARMYRTGDACRWLPDGNLEFLGRLDGQVKIRGFRVELGEIEAVLAEHPQVRQAVVVARDGAGGVKELAAHIVAAGTESTLHEPLRRHLQSRLPAYMVPTVIRVRDHLPLTPSGKVDRQALAAAREREDRLRGAPEGPRDDLEAQVVGLWKGLLGRAEVGLNDDFLELGGHSLVAMRLAAKLGVARGRTVPVGWVFEHPTPARLAAALRSPNGGDPLEPEEAIAAGPAEEPGPLSREQEALWFLHHALDDPSTYHEPFAWRLRGRLDMGRLEQAFAGVVAHHGGLRTRFLEIAGRPRQQVEPSVVVPWRVEDLRPIPGEPQEVTLRRRLREETRRPFDLARAPLLRLLCLRTGEDEHVLLLTMHHIISDEWSVGLTLRRLRECWRGESAPGNPAVTEPRIRHADYARWQARWLRSRQVESQRSYWRTRLAGSTGAIAWPGARPGERAAGGDTLAFEFDAAAGRALERCGQEEGATPFTSWLALFLVLLHRITGQGDLVVGTPVSLRRKPELQTLVGYFLNLLPLRSRLGTGLTFRQFLRATRTRLLEDLAHPDVPFDEIHRENADANDAGPRTLRAAFVLNQAGEGELDLPGLVCAPEAVTTGTAKFELTLFVRGDAQAGWRGSFEYACGTLDEATVRQMVGELGRVLARVTAAPDDPASITAGGRALNSRPDPPPTLPTRPVLASPPPPPGSRPARGLEGWNRTAVAYPREATLGQLFAEHAMRTPGAVAVVCGEERITYEELDCRSRRLAKTLRTLGLQPGARVALYLDRSPEFIVAVLAVVRSGAAYVPLPTGDPATRLAFILEDSAARIVLFRGEFPAALDSPARRCLDLRDVENEPVGGPGSAEAASETVTALSEAYVMYTSGTTGQPKGVRIPHRGIVRLVHGTDFVPWGPEQRFLMLAPTAFDASTLELWGPLLHGGRCIILPEAPLDPEALERCLTGQGVTCLFLTTGLFNFLVDERPGVLRSVRHVLTGGEVISRSHVRRASQALPETRLVNCYGPTESTTFACTHAIGPDDLAPGAGPIPIGRPIANTRCHVLDADGQEVPVGEAGELYLGGDGIALGYLNRPELTAERFVPDPFGEPGERLYRTGDRCRQRADGAIEFLGRDDGQVKVRGFRIELEEIETAILAEPDVRAAAVAALRGRNEILELAAFLVPRDRVPDAAALKARLRRSLPDAMVPSAFFVLERLPLTRAGKVDRPALLRLLDEGSATPLTPGGDQHRVPPRNALEAELVRIWEQVLGRSPLGVHDGFFKLGGHSLLLLRLVSRVRGALHLEVSIRDLYEAPTVAQLAERLSTRRRKVPQTLRSAPREGPIPASPIQEQFWILSELDPASPAYIMAVALRLRGPLAMGALRQAFSALIERHESLRTHLTWIDGELTQIIASPRELEIELDPVPIVAPAEGNPETRIAAFVDDAIRRPFDREHGPLFRIHLGQLGPADHVLLVALHHAIADGWSLGILFRELTVLYRALADDEQSGRSRTGTGRGGSGGGTLPPPGLAELPARYADFARWERTRSNERAYVQALEFWRAELAGAPQAIEFPQGASLEPAGGPDGVGRRVLPLAEVPTKSSAAAAADNDDAADSGASLFQRCLAGIAIVLHRWTGSGDFVLGTVVADRLWPEVEEVVGCFLGFVPIRIRLTGDETGDEVRRRLGNVLLEGQDRHRCPFLRLVEAVNPERKPGRNPLYNVALVQRRLPDPLFSHPAIQVDALDVAPAAALLDLRFELEETARGAVLGCEFRTRQFHPTTIDALLEACRDAEVALRRTPRLRVLDFAVGGPLAATAAPAPAAPPGADAWRIAVASTFTAEPIEESLVYWNRLLGLEATVEFAPYHQVFQALLDPDSRLRRNRQGWNVLLIRPGDWRRSEPDPRQSGVGNTTEEFLEALRAAVAQSRVPWIVGLPPEAGIDPAEAERLGKRLARVEGVTVLTAASIARWYPVETILDAVAEAAGGVPYTPEYFTALGTAVGRRIRALSRPPVKVIVLDCDGTLWDGACAEDGPEGVRLTPEHEGLQRFMLAQWAAGRLLCISSRNDEADVLAVFAKQPAMPLRLEHFAARRINWEPKSTNLASLASELGLGLESFVFVDDNPLECADVLAGCPAVEVVELPSDTAGFPAFLDHCWAFDLGRVTEEDRQRNQLYGRERERQRAAAAIPSLAAFIAGLDLRIEIVPMAPEQVPRVAQLTQRTNQFNCTHRRWTETELLARPAGTEVLAVRVSDRFGDYGWVGAMVFETRPPTLVVGTFLLSCRALGRGVEHVMLARLGEQARAAGCHEVEVLFETTTRNRPAAAFLDAVAGPPQTAADERRCYRLAARAAEDVVFVADRPDNLAPEPRPTAAPPGSGPPPRPRVSDREIALATQRIEELHRHILSELPPTSHASGAYVSPRNETERALCDLWQRLLRVERIGITDDFFAAGGHSLLALQMVSEIQRVLGRTLAVSELFRLPDVRSLARVLDGGEAEWPYASLVPLRTGGTKPPFFFIHGWGGDVFLFLPLARLLPPDQPVYGLQAPVKEAAGETTTPTVEELAGRYVREIRQFQPNGPYYLGGYCLGGWLAYEVARRLRREGQSVAMLAALDTPPMGILPWWLHLRPFAAHLARRLPHHARTWWIGQAGGRWRYLLDRATSVVRLLRSLREPSPEPAASRTDPADPALSIPTAPDDPYLLAVQGHRPGRYDGPIDYFLAQDMKPYTMSAWRHFARGGLRIHPVPGQHLGFLVEPASLAEFALIFTRALRTAQSRAMAWGGAVGEPAAEPPSCSSRAPERRERTEDQEAQEAQGSNIDNRQPIEACGPSDSSPGAPRDTPRRLGCRRASG